TICKMGRGTTWCWSDRAFAITCPDGQTSPVLMATASFQTAAHDPQAAASTHLSAAQIRNRILDLLPQDELSAVLARCETVTIQSKEVVFRREEPMNYVYFPENCVISLVTEMDDGDSVEAMTVGSDGFAGMAVFHSAPNSRLKAI